MRVFVAGASGAIGTRLVPQLIESGDEVVGATRAGGTASGKRTQARSSRRRRRSEDLRAPRERLASAAWP